MISNQKRQLMLDAQKWEESEKEGYDKAGAMEWCNSCKYQQSNEKSTLKCIHDGSNMDPCAKAYNKMVKKSS